MNLQEFESDLRKLGIISKIDFQSTPSLDFDGDFSAATYIAITFVLTSFTRSFNGRAENATWDLIAKIFDRRKKLTGRIRIAYQTKSQKA